jgi:hypothetical protein
MKKALFIMCVVCVGVASMVFAGTLVFKNMVTKPVLEKAISELANDLRREYSYTKQHGLTWTAGVDARHAVFEKEMGDNYDLLYASLAADFDNPENYWVKKGGAKKSVRQLYENIMKSARETLQNLDVLKAMYLSHKDNAVVLIRKYGIANELKAELAVMLPYFNGTLDAKTAELCESKRIAWQKWVKGGNYDDLYNLELKLSQEHQLTSRNFNYYEWPLRRKAEGGQQLVDMWAWIITDMISSI